MSNFYLIPTAAFVALLSLAEHAKSNKDALAAANAKLAGDDTSISQLTSDLANAKTQEGDPLPDDLATRLDTVTNADVPPASAPAPSVATSGTSTAEGLVIPPAGTNAAPSVSNGGPATGTATANSHPDVSAIVAPGGPGIPEGTAPGGVAQYTGDVLTGEPAASGPVA